MLLQKSLRRRLAAAAALCLTACSIAGCGTGGDRDPGNPDSVNRDSGHQSEGSEREGQPAGLAGDMEQGSFITFGTYQGEPVLWRVIGSNVFGDPLLYSEYIIDYMAFDNAFWMANTDKNYGNNYWAASDLRTWLNSQTEYVKYDKDGGPTAGTVKDGWNSYDGEPGFLSGFTGEEISAIFSSRNRQLMDEVNQTGDAVENPEAPLHRYEGEIESCLANYEEAKYLYSTEKVFLLDIREFYELVYKGGYPVEKQPTPYAERTAEHERDGGFESYWLRSPRVSSGSPEDDPKYNGASAKPDGASVRTVYSPELVLAADAYDGTVGVVPALYLKHSTRLTGGQGTPEDPYVTDGSQYGIELFTHEKALTEGESWKTQAKGLGLGNKVRWEVTEGTEYVSVEENGTISAKSPGTALITAFSLRDGEAKDSVRVTVYEALPEHVPPTVEPAAGELDAAGGNTVSQVFTVRAGENEKITDVTLAAAGTVFALTDLQIAEDGRSATFTLTLLEGKTLQDKEPYAPAVTVVQEGRFTGGKPGKVLKDPEDKVSFGMTVVNLGE